MAVYREANDKFTNIIRKYGKSNFEGARLVAEKAKSRLAVLRVMENNLEEAQRLFAELKAEGNDWRQKTYASGWLQRISKLKKQGRQLANCGSRALGQILAEKDDAEAAEQVRALKPDAANGFSIQDLQTIAKKNGYELQSRHLQISELTKIPLPAIAHIDREATGGLGHYWIIESMMGHHQL